METRFARIVRPLAIGLAILAWAGAPEANAQVTFLQTPDFSFGAFLDDSTATGPDATILADDFTLSKEQQIGRVRFWGFYAIPPAGSFTGTPDDNFTINFFADEGGVPASNPFATAAIAALFRQLDVINNGVNVYVANFVTPILVPAGTSWISIVNAVEGPNSENKFWWEASDIPGSHVFANPPHGGSTDWFKGGDGPDPDDGPDPLAIPEKNLAFELMSTPEPSSIVLTALAGAGVATVWWRRRRVKATA
jgi:hypothetical protein